MKTTAYLLVFIIFGRFVFIEYPNHKKPEKTVKIVIETNEIILQKNKINDLISKIEYQQCVIKENRR
jgi:hypothetical protein